MFLHEINSLFRLSLIAELPSNQDLILYCIVISCGIIYRLPSQYLQPQTRGKLFIKQGRRKGERKQAMFKQTGMRKKVA